MVRIGLPKGNLLEKSIKLTEKLIGSTPNRAKLHFVNDDYTILLLKHRDIPNMVELGLLDCGITSFEWLKENKSNVKVLDILDWCDVRISLIKAIDTKVDMKKNIICGTEFPNIAHEFFINEGVNHTIYKLSGSSEACVPLLFDFCVDCVETGNTLTANNLTEESVIFESKTVFISNNNIDVNRKEIAHIRQIINT